MDREEKLARLYLRVHGELPPGTERELQEKLTPGAVMIAHIPLDEYEALDAIKVAALELLNALAVDEEWDHLIVEQRTIDAVSALSKLVRR